MVSGVCDRAEFGGACPPAILAHKRILIVAIAFFIIAFLPITLQTCDRPRPRTSRRQPAAEERWAGVAPRRIYNNGTSPCRILASLSESIFPPETTQTTFPLPAPPASVQATGVAPAPSAITRFR